MQNKKNLAMLMIGCLVAISILVAGNTKFYNTNAQPMNDMTNNSQANWTGSIDIMTVIRDAFDPLIQINLSNATSIAEKHVGEKSSAVASFIHPTNGYLVYITYVIDENKQVTKVIIDAGNGQILETTQMTIEEFMHKIHSGMKSAPNGMGMMDSGMKSAPNGMGMMG